MVGELSRTSRLTRTTIVALATIANARMQNELYFAKSAMEMVLLKESNAKGADTLNSVNADKYVDVCFDIRTVRAIRANRIPVATLIEYEKLETSGKALEAAILVVQACVENQDDLQYVMSLDSENFVAFMQEWMSASVGNSAK